MGSLLNHPLFKLIRAEHLSLFEMATAPTESLSISELSKKMTEHHHNEEQYLFSLLNTKARVCEGGPMCTYFFDAHITSPPLKIAEDLTKIAPIIPHSMNEFWTNKSPLRIPSSEHIALKHILEFSVGENLQKNFNTFQEILRNNIKKEEECLFHICSRLLTKTELDTLYDSWRGSS